MIAIPTIRDLSRVRGACAASVWLLCAAAGCADANLETSRIGTDSGIEDGGGQDASTPDAHVPSSCTDGVDCYCDRASDASDPLYDPDMLFCEDFEAFSNTNASLWNARYGSSVASCGAGSTRAGPAPDACINFLTEGACDAQGGDPGNDCVLDGNTALGFKYEQGRTGGIFGQANFAPTRTLGITYATKHTENFQPAGPAWKSNEYGKGWHAAGTKTHKQNVFDDFIAAAEWLIAEKYTRPQKLAVHGRSNGGLLIGAVMTQRPDLFGVALPAVGVLDMLRYHTASANAYQWGSDFGWSENEEDFRALRAYSPVHNVRPGSCFPPTLLTTANLDDRVVPWHSYKFAAALQHAQGCDSPVLLRIETRAGHGGQKPTWMRIEDYADQWAFAARHLGMAIPD